MKQAQGYAPASSHPPSNQINEELSLRPPTSIIKRMPPASFNKGPSTFGPSTLNEPMNRLNQRSPPQQIQPPQMEIMSSPDANKNSLENKKKDKVCY